MKRQLLPKTKTERRMMCIAVQYKASKRRSFHIHGETRVDSNSLTVNTELVKVCQKMRSQRSKIIISGTTEKCRTGSNFIPQGKCEFLHEYA